jgi:hypothetical protein
MTIESNFLEKMSTTNLDNINSMDFVLNLDLLNGCDHFCDGCFINKTKIHHDWEHILDQALLVATDLTTKGLRFRELILGPTDIFSAKNTIEILKNKKFQKLLTLNTKTRITASCIFDQINKQRFIEIFEILDNPKYYRAEMILEFLVPLHTKKMLDKDDQYFNDNKWALDYFKTQTPKIIDWSYVININNNQLLKENYDQIVKTIKTEFGTILEFNPGFFRTNNRQLADKKLSYWKSFLQHVLAGKSKENFCLTNIDKHHNTANTICLNFVDHGVYFSPFIYEQIIDQSDEFKITSLTAASIIERHEHLQISGFKYATKTKDCESCTSLTSCVGRNVLNYMEIKNYSECLFPEILREVG